MFGEHTKNRLTKLLRRGLNYLEIHGPFLAKDVSLSQDSLGDISDYLGGKIAVIKQEVYQDLYCCAPGQPAREILLTSLHRSGPVALFTELNAHAFIVKLESDPECAVWKEKVFDCQQRTEDFYLSLRSKVFRNGAYGHQCPQGQFAVSCDSIDWGEYKVVVSYDIAVPARITCQFPQVTWCYYIGEPCMRTYKGSLARPVAGYDLFLNQRFRRIRLLPRPARHVLEFPYFVQRYGCFHRALEVEDDPARRSAVFIESRSKSELSEGDLKGLSRFGPLSRTSGSIGNVLRELMRSKYFIVLGGRKWGNAMIEAISAGCLVVGNPGQQHHASLFTPGTCCGSVEEIISRLEWFENDKRAFDRELTKQRRLVEWVCFSRPVRDLFLKSQRIQENRSKSRLTRA